MKVFALLSLASAASAFPWGFGSSSSSSSSSSASSSSGPGSSSSSSSSCSSSSSSGNGQCISQHAAEQFVNRFIGILTAQGSDLGDQTATAQALLADNFQEISDSILTLEQRPLGSVDANKQSFIQGVTHAPPDKGVETIKILVAGCNDILWYWNFKQIGNAKNEIKGFNLFSMNKHMQVETLQLEFNSIAWAENIGWTVTAPANSGPPGPPQ